MIRTRSLTKDFVVGRTNTVHAVRGVTLDIEPGELVAVLGPNGAGKSTLAKAVAGVVAVFSGSVRLDGNDIANLPAHRITASGVGFVPQTENVFPSLTIEENLEMGSYQAPKRFAERFDFVADLFPALGQRRKQRAGSLSGGERQMVAMGRALMMDPSVIFLDEPSAGLSPALQDEVFIRVRQINRAGVSVVMVEQNARLALSVADFAYVMESGRIVLDGEPDRLRDNEDVKEFYLGLGELGQRKSYRDVKHYKRRKRWLS